MGFISILCHRLIHSVSKNLAEHGDKIDEETKAEVQKAIDEAKALESAADVDAVKSKAAALSTASMKIGQAIYGKKGAEGDAAAPGATDATYDEKDSKEEKK